MAWRAIIELRFKQRISFYSAMNRDKCQAIIFVFVLDGIARGWHDEKKSGIYDTRSPNPYLLLSCRFTGS